MKKLVLISIAMILIAESLYSQDSLYFGFSKAGRINTYAPLPNKGTGINPNYETRFLSTSQGVFSIGANFRLYASNIGTQSETIVTAHPKNPNILFASANVFGLPGIWLSCGHYISTDQGMTWHGSDTTGTNYGDPSVVIDKDGIFLLSHIHSSEQYAVSYSLDSGIAWSQPVIIPGSSTSSDKGFMTTDSDPSSPYYGRTYCAFSTLNDLRIVCSYTNNGGVSWSYANQITIGTSNRYDIGVDLRTYQGVVYAVWAHSVYPYTGTEDSLGFAKSTNGGVNWVNVTNHAVNMNGIRTTDLLNLSSDTIRANGLPRIDIDQNSGNIYVVTAEKNFSPATDSADIILMKSTNLGTSWTRSKVNQNTNFSYEWFSCNKVDDGGALNVLYYSTRNSSAHDSAEMYLSRSTDQGNTWIDIKVSDHKFRPKPLSGLPVIGYQGDYIGLTSIGNGKLFACWTEQGPTSGGRHQIWGATVKIPVSFNFSTTVLQEGFYNTGTNRTAMKDTVRAYLRNNFVPYVIEDSAIAVLDSVNFTGSFSFTNTTAGNYYVIVKHRNSLETWSTNPISISNGGSYSYNFTSGSSQAYGGNQVLVDNSPTTYAMYSGDINQNGAIDNYDVLPVYNDASNYITGYVTTDVTGDKIVDLDDLLIVNNNSGNFVAIQRPS